MTLADTAKNWGYLMANRRESLHVLAGLYDAERAKLLGNEGDTDQLWRVVVAADKLAEAVFNGVG